MGISDESATPHIVFRYIHHHSAAIFGLKRS